MFSTFELQQLICPLLFASDTSFAEELLVRVVVCLFCFCIFLSLFSYSCRLRRNKSFIGDLPTSKTQGVFIGIVELKGVAVSRRIRYSPYTGQKFVFCQITIAEEWMRWETETYYDFSEQCYKTKQVQHSGWTPLEGIRTKAPFYLQDDTGKIRVWPEGAEMDITQSWQETVTPDSPFYNRISRPEIKDSTHRRRITETIIKPGEALYLLGVSRLREDIVAPEIALDDQPRAYMISTRSEENISLFCDIDIILYHFWAFIFWCFAGLCLFPGTTLYELIPAACCAAAYLPLIFITWMYQTYASLIQLKHLTIQGKSNIDVQLKRRNDLIPSMVSLVKQYCRHEKEIQQQFIQLNRQMLNQQKNATDTSKPVKIGVYTPLMTVLGESYPELQASELFINLKKQIIDTEQKIMLARNYYNDIVFSFNTRIQSFPANIMAMLCQIKPIAPIKIIALKNKAGKK